jgi:hypothetical protein
MLKTKKATKTMMSRILENLPERYIYLERNEDGAWSNLPQWFRDYTDGGYEWGIESDKVGDLALNILHWALLRRGYDGPVTPLNDNNEVFTFAYVMHDDYWKKVLLNLPYDKAVIDLHDVWAWIDGYPYLENPCQY